MDILYKVLDKHYTGKWRSFPSPTGTMDDFENIDWVGDAPSKSDFQAQYDAEEQAYNNTQYQRDRKYPDLGEQFDLLFKDINEGTLDKTGGFYTAIKAVKDKHPKPSE